MRFPPLAAWEVEGGGLLRGRGESPREHGKGIRGDKHCRQQRVNVRKGEKRAKRKGSWGRKETNEGEERERGTYSGVAVPFKRSFPPERGPRLGD